MLRRLLLLIGLLVASPALAMPNAEELRAMVAARIAEAAGPGLLEIENFRRMGQAPDPAGGARIAYFAARLRLTRDHEFGAWDGRNLQALAAALGAAPRAILGANRDGNRSGDVIRVNGALRLREEAGRWVPLASAAWDDTPPTNFDGPGAQAERLLAAIGTALTAGGRAAGAELTPVIEQELAQAWRNIEARQARLRHGMPVAGGAVGSEYARLVEAMARIPPPPGLGRTVALPSAGSVENLRLIASRTALAGIAQADVALAALQGGTPAWDLPAVPGLRAIAALFPEAVHVAVPAGSAIRRMADLAGRPVGVGVSGSGARITAEEVLLAHGLDATRTPRVPLAPDEVAAALGEGRIAAAIAVSLAPAQAELRLADAVPLRFLPLEEAAMASLAAGQGPLIRFAIPAGTYPNQEEAVPTLATQAVLVAADTLTQAEVTTLLGRLLNGQGLAAAGGPAAMMIRRETAGGPLPLPFHPAAMAFFEQGRR